MSVPCFSARRCRCDQRRRRGAHVAPCGSRVPADAGAARHARGDPRSREPCAVGHQHPAVARVRRDGRHARCARRRAHRGPRRSRARREIRRRVRLLPARMGVAVYRPTPQGRLGPVRPVEHRPRREGAHACATRPQLPFLRCAGRIVLHARPRDDLRRLARLRDVPAGRDDGRVHARSIPVRRPRSCRFTGSSPNTSAFPPTNSWCAGCRSAMRTPTRSRTASSPSARRSPSSRAFRLKTHDAALPFEQACIVRRTCRDASCHIAIEIDRA